MRRAHTLPSAAWPASARARSCSGPRSAPSRTSRGPRARGARSELPATRRSTRWPSAQKRPLHERPFGVPWARRSEPPGEDSKRREPSGERRLPPVVREGLVGLRHAEDVVLALVGAALLGLRVHQLVGQALGHRLLAAVAGELDQPADGEGAGARGGHLDRDLVGGATDTAGANLQHRGERLDRDLQRFDGLLARTLAENRQRVIHDALGGRLLAVQHHLVDDLLNELGTVDGVRINGPAPCGCATRHLYFALTPYWERAFLRSETPAASSVPRTTL